MNAQRKGRLMLALLLAVFALPVVIAIAMYATDWRARGDSHGELLQPPRSLRFSELQTLKGKSFDGAAWRGKWHLVYVTDRQCSGACGANLHAMRQVHVALAKEADRLERVWLIKDAPPVAELEEQQRLYPDLVVLAGAKSLAEQFDSSGNAASRKEHIFLVDPLGNLILSYPPGADPYGMLKDLLRLLKYSWTG